MNHIQISYHFLHHNWYVYEIYHKLHERLLDMHINVEYTPIESLASYHNETFNHRLNHIPSLYNIYNLIITNKNKNISFVHSLHDNAHHMLDHDTAIEKLGVTVFASSSNITQSLIDAYAFKLLIRPSFYILEYFNDHDFIKKYTNRPKDINKAFFNGYTHSLRQMILNHLNSIPFFDLKDKAIAFQSKKDYFDTLSRYRYGLSLEGVASICYRDLEYFGLNILNLRQQLHTLTVLPLEENIHYKNIINDHLLHRIVRDPHSLDSSISEEILYLINNITEEEYNFITHNARQWFEHVVDPEQQVNILVYMLLDAGII